MCLVCGFPDCTCPPQKLPPCNPCEEDSGCNPKIAAKCITVNSTNVDVFLQCNNFLDYLYACLVANPDQYQKYCNLWAGCDNVCGTPIDITVIGDPTVTSSVIVSWNTFAGITYDIYLDTVLVQANTPSPKTLTGLTYGVPHDIEVIAHCPNGATNSSTVTVTLCVPATSFHINVGLSTANSALVQWTPSAGVVYDLYLNTVLKQSAATSPYVFTGLLPSVLYTARIVSNCSGGISTFYEITFTLT